MNYQQALAYAEKCGQYGLSLIHILLLRYEINPEDVDKVYLAGGFGYRMDVEKAVGIGLIPEVFTDKIRVIGNGALEGAVRYGREEGAMDLAEDIVKISSEIGPVSYTHLDVYKRQISYSLHIGMVSCPYNKYGGVLYGFS